MVAETAAGAAVGVGASTAIDAIRDGSSRNVEILEKILAEITLANRYAERQKKRTLEPIDIGAETTMTDGIGIRAQIDGRRRGSHLLISGGTAGDEFYLMVGTSPKVRFVIGSTDPKEIDLPMGFTGDVYLQNITTVDDATWRAVLWLYSDQDDLSGKRE